MADTHATSGTALRDAHSLSGQGLRFNLDEERRQLDREQGRTSGGRVAKSLAKSDRLRVTLVHLRKGTVVTPESRAGEASVQVLSGRLSLQVDSHAEEASAGDLFVFSQNLREPVRALEDSTLLVTVAWPEGAGAWDLEERQGRH